MRVEIEGKELILNWSSRGGEVREEIYWVFVSVQVEILVRI